MGRERALNADCVVCGEPFNDAAEVAAHMGRWHRQGADDVAEEEPMLGLATTRQMLEELVVRFEIPTPDDAVRMSLQHWLDVIPDAILDYRTVDSDG